MSVLREARLARGLSLRFVGGMTDIHIAHLSRVERGEATLSVEALGRLAAVLFLDEAAVYEYVMEASRQTAEAVA